MAFSIISLISGLVIGFTFANSINRTEINSLRSENESLKKAFSSVPQTSSTNTTLSPEEIRQSIARADQNPNDIALQRNMGLALYSYGAIRQDANLILEAARLLQRALQSKPDDYDVLVSLGHAFYDAASIRQENQNFLKAREYYRKALEQKNDDAEIRADYGSTYFLADPADFEKALSELQQALQINPKSERALQLLIQAYIKQKNLAEAEKYLAKLKEVNPNNIRIPDLTNEINQARR